MKNHPYPAATGMTLVELSVVIAIAAILAMVAIPSFVAMTQRFRAISAANAFAADLRLARSEALKQGVPVTVCTSADGLACANRSLWQTGWIVFADPAANKTVTTVLKRQQPWTSTDTFTPSVAIDAITFGREGFPQALPAANGVTFTLHSTPPNPMATQCVAMTRTGRVTQTTGVDPCA